MLQRLVELTVAVTAAGVNLNVPIKLKLTANGKGCENSTNL